VESVDRALGWAADAASEVLSDYSGAVNNDCDTGYCYVERSVCSGMDCDPVQVADADPEACLREGIPCVKKNGTGQCIGF